MNMKSQYEGSIQVRISTSQKLSAGKNHCEEGRNLELIMQKNVMISELLLLFLLL